MPLAQPGRDLTSSDIHRDPAPPRSSSRRTECSLDTWRTARPPAPGRHPRDCRRSVLPRAQPRVSRLTSGSEAPNKRIRLQTHDRLFPEVQPRIVLRAPGALDRLPSPDFHPCLQDRLRAPWTRHAEPNLTPIMLDFDGEVEERAAQTLQGNVLRQRDQHVRLRRVLESVAVFEFPCLLEVVAQPPPQRLVPLSLLGVHRHQVASDGRFVLAATRFRIHVLLLLLLLLLLHSSSTTIGDDYDQHTENGAECETRARPMKNPP